jgi:hypothetical protein
MWLGMRVDQSQSSATRRVQRRMIPKPRFARAVTALGALRTHFYGHTIPWKCNGDRLLPVTLFVPVMREHLRLKKEFDAEVERFVVEVYQPAREHESFRLRDQFDDHDWPTADEMRKRFYVHLTLDQMAPANGFAMDLGDERVNAAVRTRLAAEGERRVVKAQRHVWERLQTEVAHYADRMAGDKIFRDTLLDHLSDTLELAPAFNLMDDPELTSLALLELPCLLGPTLKTLRTDKQARAAAAAMAQKYLSQIERKLATLGD